MNDLLKLILALWASGLIALTLGCTANKIPPVPNANGGNSGNPGFHADFRTQPTEVKAGEPATIIIAVKDGSGALVRDLDIEQEKPMHLVVVSKDLAEFYHIHPQLQTDGTYQVGQTFPNGGRYEIYADFTPVGTGQVIARDGLAVMGDARPAIKLAEDATLTKTVENLRVRMEIEKPLRAGQEVMLKFTVADAISGKPVTDLQPYLGSLAHFVIISEDTSQFVHAHAMKAGEQKGASDNHEGMSREMPKASVDELGTSAAASEVSAHTTFPRPGLYKLWAQFQRSGKVIATPFVVRVAE